MCKCCQDEREFGVSAFDPACLYCGARIIQKIRNRTLPLTERKTRMRAELEHWKRYGHDEQRIRDLVNGPMAIKPNAHS